MMKTKLLILSMLTFASQVYAAEEVKAPAETTVYGGASIKEGTTLSKLMADPDIAAQYTSCKTALKDKLEEIPKCLWEGGKNGSPSALSGPLKEKVKKIYAEEENAPPQSGATPSTNFTGRTNNIQTDYSSDPAVQALSTFFGKKLDEVLNGSDQDKKDKKIMSVEHSAFINIYTSELGKSVVNAFTSYCLESKADCLKDGSKALCIIPKDEQERKDAKKTNLASINKADLSAKAGAVWTHCIGTVSDVCYNNDSTEDDHTYSKQRACLVMDFVKSARKNLIIAGEQKQFYEDLGKVGVNNIEDKKGRFKQVTQKDLSADNLTKLTSADIVSDVKKANDQSLKEATDCDADINKAKCDKFLDDNKTKNNDAVAEFGLRQFAKADDLDDKLKDKTNVSSYLKEEGYTDEQITNLTKPDNIQDIKDKIKKRFAEEKDAIIKEMADRVKAKTSATDGSINQKDDSTKLDAIKRDLQNRNEDLKNLVHFNNIVSSYLSIEKEDKSTTRNTASLFAEVNSMDKKDSQALLENIKKNKDIVEQQETPNLSITDINKILKYQDPPK